MKKQISPLFILLMMSVLLVACEQKESPVEESTSAIQNEVKKVEKKIAEKPKVEKVTKEIKKVTQPSSSKKLILMDFNAGEKPNNLGGDMGAWDKDPADNTQTCQMSFEAGDDALGDANGFSLRLKYDVDSPNPAYNGFWTKLEGEDLSTFKTLNFYLKGDVSSGFATRIKIEIKDFSGNTAKYTVNGITNSWKQFSVPFERFVGANRLDWTEMSEFVIVFDDVTSDPKTGSILFDEVTVS